LNLAERFSGLQRGGDELMTSSELIEVDERVECQECSTRFTIDDDDTGDEIECPSCGSTDIDFPAD
jgi:DNA-directed RNA polymerase subunit RPC12/RpoP